MRYIYIVQTSAKPSTEPFQEGYVDFEYSYGVTDNIDSVMGEGKVMINFKQLDSQCKLDEKDIHSMFLILLQGCYYPGSCSDEDYKDYKVDPFNKTISTNMYTKTCEHFYLIEILFYMIQYNSNIETVIDATNYVPIKLSYRFGCENFAEICNENLGQVIETYNNDHHPYIFLHKKTGETYTIRAKIWCESMVDTLFKRSTYSNFFDNIESTCCTTKPYYAPRIGSLCLFDNMANILKSYNLYVHKDLYHLFDTETKTEDVMIDDNMPNTASGTEKVIVAITDNITNMINGSLQDSTVKICLDDGRILSVTMKIE